MLSYPHKINWRRLTNVCYGSFTRSETLETYIFKIVHWQFGVNRQTVIWSLRARARQNKYVCLSVCESVCLTVYHKGILPLASDLVIRHCLGLKHNFFRQRRPQVKTIQIGQHKENMWWWLRITLVTQVVSESVQCSKGFELKQQNLIACLSVCHKPTILFQLCLKLDFSV